MTRENAIAMAESGWWKTATPEQIVGFQLYERRLCMDFGDFHGAVEKVLGRAVWTHEFASTDHLKAEFEGKAKRPTMQEILDLIPADKWIVVLGAGRGGEPSDKS